MKGVFPSFFYHGYCMQYYDNGIAIFVHFYPHYIPSVYALDSKADHEISASFCKNFVDYACVTASKYLAAFSRLARIL